MRLEPSCLAPLPHLSHALRDYPRTMDHVCSAGRHHRIVYPTGTVANRSGMSQASASRLVVHQAYCSGLHHTRVASGSQEGVQTWTTTQPSMAESWSCTEASEVQSSS